MKKTLSLALSLVMIIATLTAMPFTAKADSYPASAVSVNSVALTSETPCYMNGATEPCAYTENANLYYNEATATLTLNNYNGDTIRFSQTNGDITVNLIGENVIDGWQYGISADGSALTVTSETGGTLSITTRNPSSGGGIVNYWIKDNNLPLTISGNANITINLSKEDADAYGFYSHGKISIIDGASVSIVSVSTKAGHNVYGIGYGPVEINTTGNISLEAGNYGNSPIALSASSINLVNVNKLSLKGNDNSSSCLCSSTNYNYLLGLKGYEIVASNEDKDYSLTLTKHKLAPVPAKENTCGANGNNVYYYCAGCEKCFKDEAGTLETTAEAETIPATGEHTWALTTVITPATCTENGGGEYTCSVCGTTKTDIIPAGAHVPKDAVKENEKAATYTAAGSYESVVYCSLCGVELSRETVTVPMLAKKANTLVAKGKTVKAKPNKKTVIKKAKAFTIKNAQGAVTFKKAKGNKKITVAKNGKITVKKGLKKGTYKIKVKVTAAGNAEYKAAVKTVTVKIVVK